MLSSQSIGKKWTIREENEVSSNFSTVFGLDWYWIYKMLENTQNRAQNHINKIANLVIFDLQDSEWNFCKI